MASWRPLPQQPSQPRTSEPLPNLLECVLVGIDETGCIDGAVASSALLGREKPEARQVSRRCVDRDTGGAALSCCSRMEVCSKSQSTMSWRFSSFVCQIQAPPFFIFKMICEVSIMYVDMTYFDGRVLVALGRDELYYFQWLLRASIIAPQLLAWSFLRYHNMSSWYALLRLSVFPVISLVLCSVLEVSLFRDVAVFIFGISLEPLHHVAVAWWREVPSDEYTWMVLAEGLIEAPTSAMLTLYPAMLLTELQGGSVAWLFCASVLWSLLCVSMSSATLHFYGQDAGWPEKIWFAVFVRFPQVTSQILGYVFFAYLTRHCSEEASQLQGVSSTLVFIFLSVELVLNYGLLKTASENLPAAIALLFSCVMFVGGPPGFLTSLQSATVPHAMQHTVMTVAMGYIAFDHSNLFSERTIVLSSHYLPFLILFFISVPWALAASIWNGVEQGRESLERRVEAVRKRFTKALHDRDAIMCGLLIAIEGARPRVQAELIETGIATGRRNWRGSATAQNGKIYCAPFDHSSVLVIDPILETVQFMEIGDESGFKWFGIACAPNGKLYCAPCTHEAVLVINPAEGTFTFIKTGEAPGAKWWGIAAGPNSKLYCAPYNHSKVLVVDSADDTVAFIETGESSASKWAGVAAAPNGMLYCAPHNHNSVLVINPMEGTSSLLETGESSTYMWAGIAAGPNGKLYCAPQNHSAVLVIDPVENSVSLLETRESSASKWAGVDAAPDGKLYCAPHNHSAVLVIDASRGKLSLVESGEESASKWDDISLAPNGKLYCAPCTHEAVLVLDPAALHTWDQSLILQELGLYSTYDAFDAMP